MSAVAPMTRANTRVASVELRAVRIRCPHCRVLIRAPSGSKDWLWRHGGVPSTVVCGRCDRELRTNEHLWL
jgi:hypothetical protein